LKWILLIFTTAMVLILLSIIIVLCCYIRSQKRQRKNALEVQARSQIDLVGADSSDIEGFKAYAQQTAGVSLQPNVQNAIVSHQPSHLTQQQQLQGTPSTIGLTQQQQVYAPEHRAESTHTQMLSAQTPLGSYRTNQTVQPQ